MYLKGRARPGPTFREALLMHAVGRLALHPYFENIQASWVKMGHDGVAACLNAGCNDLGGTLMNETITRAAGATHGQEWDAVSMSRFIEGLDREPWQRNTLYEPVTPERTRAALDAAPLAPVNNTAAGKYERKRGGELLRNRLIARQR
jgi:FO synthase